MEGTTVGAARLLKVAQAVVLLGAFTDRVTSARRCLGGQGCVPVGRGLR